MQFGEVGAKLIGSANRGCEVGDRARGVECKVGQPLLSVLELAAQDQRARAALLKQLAQFRLSDALTVEHRPQSRLQCGIERLASLGERTRMIHAGGIMAGGGYDRREGAADARVLRGEHADPQYTPSCARGQSQSGANGGSPHSCVRRRASAGESLRVQRSPGGAQLLSRR